MTNYDVIALLFQQWNTQKNYWMSTTYKINVSLCLHRYTVTVISGIRAESRLHSVF